MTLTNALPTERFLHSLGIVHKEGGHLLFSHDRLASQAIDVDWVLQLDERPVTAIELDAFVARFGRTQDSIGEKLLPRWLNALAESAGSQIEVLDRAERLGVLESTEEWIAVRRLRNLLIHEYVNDPRQFAQTIREALHAVTMLVDTYNRIRSDALTRLGLPQDRLPPPLPGVSGRT